MQLFFNSEETSGAVLICAELQIAFRKLVLERNTKRAVKANYTVWGCSTNGILYRNLLITFVRIGPFLLNRYGKERMIQDLVSIALFAFIWKLFKVLKVVTAVRW